MADIAVVPPQGPGQGNIDLPRVINPYLSVWWTSQSVSGVPEVVMGWLVAQGWEITNVAEDTSTTPSTYTYELGKQGMQPWQVLLSLCNSYTIAANEARGVNQFRYNQIVAAWTSMVSSSQDHFDAQILEQNTAMGVYVGDLSDYMNDIHSLSDANQAALGIEAEIVKEELAAMLAKLVDLETNADATAETIETLLADQSGYLSTFVTDFAAKLSALDSDYLAHLAEVLELLTRADESHIAHELVATGFLDDLGATELARINEQFVASLSTQIQDLAGRGLYSGAVGVDVRARNTRDRDEQIQALNDKLNREKFENQHRVYGQLQELIRWTAVSRDKLFEQLSQIATQYLAWYDKKHGAEQDVSRAAVAVRSTLLGQLQDAVKGILAGKTQYASLTMQNASTLADHQHKAIVEKMNEYVARLQGGRDVTAENQRLMAYQLDTRNNLLIGLYAFVERREDIGPKWNEMSSMIAGLADSAGGWIQP